MEKINLAEGLMAQMMEEEAWKNLSRNFGFTIQMLEKYQDKLDWKEVSENTTIVWTMDILEKFKKRISWKAFSEYCDESVLTPEIIERFKEHFDWHALSSKSDLPMFIYDKYSDLLDWKKIINTYDRRERLNRAFFEKYRDYIPASAFKDSTLWENIVDEIRLDLENKIRNGE